MPKISDLPEVVLISGNEMLVVVQGNETKRMSLDDLLGDTVGAAAAVASAAAAALGTPAAVFRTVTANAVAEPFDFIAADTSAGSPNLTLPAAGGFVSVRDIANAWETNPLTIIGNGRTIDGNPTLLADLSGFDVEFASFGPVWRYSLKPMYGG